jgi:hypothetical protein
VIEKTAFWVFFLYSALCINNVDAQRSGFMLSQQKANVPPDEDATFQVKISLVVRPEIATSYDRTSISIESSPAINFEVVEIRDETRDAKAKSRGGTLETLFGPKNGLTDHVVVSALVRVPHQSGEKFVRRTIRLRNVAPEIWRNAETHGRVRINVQLDASGKSQGSDSTAQRIAKAQDDLLLNLAGTDFKILRKFESEASFLLETGTSALTVLDRFPQVIKIKEDVRGFIQ